MALLVTEQLAGLTVLLTGSTGFIGSLVLEQLLRLVNVKQIYLLIRSRKGVSAAARLQKLLKSPLYLLIRQQAAQNALDPLDKLQALDSDISMPDLGLDPAQIKLLRAEVNLVIHCAADIALNPGIQTTIRHNHLSTGHLLRLASRMNTLHCFVHMSTFGVSYHQPWNSLAKEQICPLPLHLHGQPLDYQQFIEQVMAMPADEANTAVQPILERLSFRSTSYAFVKHLTEQLVDSYALGPHVSKVIVRPSMVTATMAQPYPGYMTGYAGLISYVMPYATGLFPSQQSVAWSGELLLDVVPCDVVASLTLAAAAAGVGAARAGAVDLMTLVYHATSSHLRSLQVHKVYQLMHAFWSAHPVPYSLANDRYILVSPEHQPDDGMVTEAQKQLASEVQQHCHKLVSNGLSTAANILERTFAAYSVFNSTDYNRLIVCSVDNVKALAARLTGPEKQQFQIVWEPSAGEVKKYMHIFQSAIRQGVLMLDGRMQGDVLQPEGQEVNTRPVDAKLQHASATAKHQHHFRGKL